MDALSWSALGFGLVCGLAPLAQAVRIRVKRSSEEISLVWLGLYGCGAAVWLAYGAARGSVPLVISQGVALASVAVIFVFAVRARRRVRYRYVPSVDVARRPRQPPLSRAAVREVRLARTHLERGPEPKQEVGVFTDGRRRGNAEDRRATNRSA